MPRHEFRPGRLLAGATGLAVAAVYAGDAAGAWDAAWYVVFPLLFGGLWLAATATWITYRYRVRRRRRSASSASTESIGAPASTSGNHAIR
ncbi:hypothetical protein [Streptomyces sp. TRM64462]|uniref:hypothetical protein n=1 Tax=Streptomyces sp. TRM64462 TaxID=2741726 RepID=UPI0015860C79|nr:hypothetical protein [Streptomyces sp. TRM64462]